MKRLVLIVAAALTLLSLGSAPESASQTLSEAPLVLEAKIPLGAVEGRIDHMAIDAKREHVFVAELGNDTVGVVSVPDRRVVSTIGGLKEPQGVGYLSSSDTLYIANAGEGSVA